MVHSCPSIHRPYIEGRYVQEFLTEILEEKGKQSEFKSKETIEVKYEENQKQFELNADVIDALNGINSENQSVNKRMQSVVVVRKKKSPEVPEVDQDSRTNMKPDLQRLLLIFFIFASSTANTVGRTYFQRESRLHK